MKSNFLSPVFAIYDVNVMTEMDLLMLKKIVRHWPSGMSKWIVVVVG